MGTKRKAIERCPPLAPDPEGEARWHASKDIIQWLEVPVSTEKLCGARIRRSF